MSFLVFDTLKAARLGNRSGYQNYFVNILVDGSVALRTETCTATAATVGNPAWGCTVVANVDAAPHDIVLEIWSESNDRLTSEFIGEVSVIIPVDGKEGSWLPLRNRLVRSP